MFVKCSPRFAGNPGLDAGNLAPPDGTHTLPIGLERVESNNMRTLSSYLPSTQKVASYELPCSWGHFTRNLFHSRSGNHQHYPFRCFVADAIFPCLASLMLIRSRQQQLSPRMSTWQPLSNFPQVVWQHICEETMQGARERSSTLVIPQATPPWSKVLQRDWSPGCGYADYRVTIEEGGCNPKLVGPNPPNLAPEGVENKRGHDEALPLEAGGKALAGPLAVK
ncbi:hypothetical protein CCM_04845 [Cordyceps militaris CM01]|uniref:Uncharacterized protein n=1 Tax=Cordyceps militaris (strain CM01) TaxID=983644 RepID=G3JEX8_CORMM|nr:uncharacterized protein CCM_04845 [Cordyceps militaris CM01]EGX93471.1 hypothetical protein CCM_04845 [Cordyceps militaris CM01]